MHSGHHPCLRTPRHPQAQMHVLTHTHVCPQMPLNPSPEIWLLPVPTSGLPARLAAPCQLPWQCCCCQEMKFALPRCGEGSRAARGPSCPSHCRACPSAWGAVPTQPRSWTLSSRLQLPHKPQTCCLQDQGKLSRRVLQLGIFTVSCGPPSARQEQACPVASRTQKVLPIPTQTQVLSVVLAASGTSGAHQGLPASPCRTHHHGLSSFNHSGDRFCWFPCRGDLLLPCCSMPCHTMPCDAIPCHAMPHHATPSHGSQQGRM